MIARTLGLRRLIVGVPPGIGYWLCRLTGLLVRDVIITREEVRGLMEGRLCVDAPPLGTTRLSEWVAAHRDALGRRYTSELLRRTDRATAYRSN
jgi:NADH dehydrogenase